MAPFRGGSGEGRESYSLGTTIRDPDIESAERRREARAASEKAKQLLDERRQAQKALKAQVKVVRARVTSKSATDRSELEGVVYRGSRAELLVESFVCWNRWCSTTQAHSDAMVGWFVASRKG